jgi:hypothetical protein
MSDVNGPRGGVDKRCQVELRTDGAGSVVVTALARDWRMALYKALARAAARFVIRLWRRGQDSRRLRRRVINHQSLASKTARGPIRRAVVSAQFAETIARRLRAPCNS